MKTFSWCIRLAVGFCLVQLFSCQKQTQSLKEDSLEFATSSEAVIFNEFNDCKLRTIVHELSGGLPGELTTGTFVYHPDGLPDRLTYTPTGTGTYNYYFFYDSKRRLREFRMSYAPDDPTEAIWHKYGYNNLNQIVVDTTYNPVVEGSTKISQLTYDNQNRVISEAVRPLGGATSQTVTYTYDSRGNLVVNGWASSSYDNNISIFRAHPLFQFVHRNYSKNNASPQAKYNAKGFPLSNTSANSTFFSSYVSPYGFVGNVITKATYDCDGYNPPNEFLYCKLRSITHGRGGTPSADPVTGTFVYHPDGLPDNLTYGSNTGTGTPNYYFLYDSKRRLREFRIGYSKTDVVEAIWHK